jgi:hypothetical protein
MSDGEDGEDGEVKGHPLDGLGYCVMGLLEDD